MNKYLIGLFTLFLCTHVQGKTTISLGLWKGWADSNARGFAPELLQKIARIQKLEITTEALPFKRSLSEFASKKADCYFGLNKEIFEKIYNTKLTESTNIINGDIVIYTKKGSPKISSYENFSKLIFGIVRGTSIEDSKIPNKDKLHLIELSNSSQAKKMVELKRIDALIGFYPDQVLLETMHFDPKFVQHTFPSTVMCHKTPGVEEFIKQINLGVKKVKASGGFKKLQEIHGLLVSD